MNSVPRFSRTTFSVAFAVRPMEMAMAESRSPKRTSSPTRRPFGVQSEPDSGPSTRATSFVSPAAGISS